MEIQAEKRFQELKRKLDALHYCQPFTIESTALVEKLLNDMLKTANGFNQLKRDRTTLMAELEADKVKVMSLSKQNERVVRENDQLHQAIIQAEEQAKEIEIKNNHHELQYKSEIEDLKFIISNKDSKIKQLEAQITKSMHKLANSSEFGYGVNLNGSMEMTAPLNDSTQAKLNQPDVKIFELEKARKQMADELVKADERATVLSAEIRRIEGSKAELEQTLQLYKEKLETRDREISRLQTANKGGPNVDLISQAYSNEVTQANIQKLNNQIDFLNRENQRLESENKEKDAVINVADKYKHERVAMGQKYTELQRENKQLLSDINQMESVIKELKEKIDDQNSVVAKRNLIPMSDLTKEREKREKLEDRISELETELRQFKRADEHNQHCLTTAESDKKTLAKRMEEMLKENRQLHNTIDEKLQEIRHLTKEKDTYKSDSEFYKDKARQMESNYERYKKIAEEVGQEKEMTEEERIKYHNKLMSVENELAEAKRQCSEINFELERTRRQKDHTESELEDLRQKTVKFKNDYENNTTTLNRIQMTNDSTLKQLTYAEKEKAMLEEQISKKTKELSQKDKEITNLRHELESSQDAHTVMRSEHKMLSDELSDKLKELEVEHRKRREIERELAEYKHLNGKLEHFEEHLENVVRLKSETEKDNTKLQSRIVELESLLKAKEKVVEEADRKYQEICIKLSEVERKGMRDDDKWEATQHFRHEVEDKQRVISEMRLKETEYIEKLEILQGEIKKLRCDIDLERDRARNIKESKEKVDYELKEARRNLVELEEQLNSGRNESIVTEKQKNQATIEIADLKNQIKNLKKDKTNLDDDNSELRKQVENLQMNLNKQQHEVSKLESLIQTLERSKEDLIQKFQNVNKERNNDERDKSMLVTEIGTLKKTLVEKEAEINDMRTSIIELDQRNDMLQSQLDYKTEELYQTQNALEVQNKQNTESRQHISIIASKEESYERRLQEREKEIEELKKHLKSINKELHDLREMDNIKTHDTNQLANDVEILTRENQAVKEQLMKLSDEKEYFKVELDNLTGRNKQLQQNIRAIEIEKGDIQTSYKEVCAENQRLKESVNSMNYRNKDSSGKAQELERNLKAAHMAIRQFEEREEQMVYEIQQYDKNISSLSHQLEMTQRDLAEAREARDSLLHDHEAQRHLSFNLETSREELQRYIMNLENERNVLISKTEELQRDLHFQRERTEYERSRYYELEMILNRERLDMQRYEQERDDLRSENDRLQSTIKKSDSFMMRRSGPQSEYEEEPSFTMNSSDKSYDNRNKVNLQKVVSQLELEIENERKEKHRSKHSK